MKTSNTRFYNIHNLLRVRVENLNLEPLLSHFLTSKVGIEPDLTIKVGKFDPQPTHNRLMGFYLGQNVLIEKRKFGSLQLIDMLEKTELDATRGYVRLRPFLCLIENILGLKLLTRNHALVHSSCLSANEQGYLICAWSGTGKTMVAIKLVKEVGLNFLSDDLTIINDSGEAYCFPKDVRLSLAHAKEFGLGNRVKLKLLLGELVNRVPYGTMKIFHNVPVSKIVENSEKVKQCEIRKVIMLQRAHHEGIVKIDLNEVVRRIMSFEAWDQIFWAARLFMPYTYCDPKFDLQKLRNKKRKVLQNTLKGIPCYEVRFRKNAYNLVSKLLPD